MTATVDEVWLRRWFMDHVLPLEPSLNRFIARQWPDPHEVSDIRQDIYEKILAKACEAQPANVKAYLFAIARNALADRWRQRRPEHTDAGMDGIAEESLGFDELTPERFFEARQELSRFEEGMKALPERCREVIRLRKVEGFSAKEVAAQMGVGIDSVHHQTMFGMRALVDFLLGGNGRIQRPTSVAKFRKAKP